MTLTASQCDNSTAPSTPDPKTEAKDSCTDGPSQTQSDWDSIKTARLVVMQKLHAGTAFISICLILKAAWGGGTQATSVLSNRKCVSVVDVSLCLCTLNTTWTWTTIKRYTHYVIIYIFYMQDVTSGEIMSPRSRPHLPKITQKVFRFTQETQAPNKQWYRIWMNSFPGVFI